METGALLKKIAGRVITDPATPGGRLLAAGARQFREKGYASTTVRDLATEVGMLSGSLFYYVRTKEEILYGVMLEVCIAMNEAIKVRLAEAKDIRSMLRALIANELAFIHGSNGNAVAVLLTEWRSLSADFQKKVLKERELYYRAWEETLAQAKKEGLVQIEPHILQRLLHGAMNGTMDWYRPDGAMDLETLADQVMLLATKSR